jgi:hypothetical protein
MAAAVSLTALGARTWACCIEIAEKEKKVKRTTSL